MNVPKRTIPMTYDDYFGLNNKVAFPDPANPIVWGHYANTAQPYFANITMVLTLGQADINAIKASANILQGIKNAISFDAMVESSFPLATSQSVPSQIQNALLNDLAANKIEPALVLPLSTPTSILAYVQSLLTNGAYVYGNNTNVSVAVTGVIDPVSTKLILTCVTNITFGGVRKFVDSLPGLRQAGANNLGNFLPVAVPDIVTYDGADYYEIALVEFTHKFHSDLEPTKVRGYVQVNSGEPKTFNANGTFVPQPRYGGPIITAQKNRPIRVLFRNLLPTGVGGDLFIPVDTSLMGASTGNVNDISYYTENRATIHLHGGVTPWISDGTPHSWTTPAGENTVYPTGVTVTNVPDMQPLNTTQGTLTFYYTNQQSARIMFYHDHAYGITRLNVYAGELSMFLLSDETERDLQARSVIPSESNTVPLIIQDKTFVPNDEQVDFQDPTWRHGIAMGFNWSEKDGLW